MSQTNAESIAAWGKVPLEALVAFDPEGDFGRRTMLNPEIFRMLGDVRDKRVLDAGCGQGYLSRMLASRGAIVVGVEPAEALYRYAVAAEEQQHRGIRFIKTDLADLADFDEPFDVVVSNVVFETIPNWTSALQRCVDVLRPGGLFVWSLEHPCFEDAEASWTAAGCVQIRKYLQEYDRPGAYALDRHRPLSAYLNATIASGCQIVEVSEPGLDPALAGEDHQAAVYVPNFIVVASRRVGRQHEGPTP